MTRRYVCLAIGLFAVALPAQAAEPVAPLNPLRSLNKGDLKAFVEQPLFDPARRLPAVFSPVAIPMAMPSDSIEPPPNLHLMGLVQGANDVALVRGPDNKTSMLSSGDSVNGWSIAVLPPNALRLSKGKRAYDYAIFVANGSMGGPVPVSEVAARQSIEGQVK